MATVDRSKFDALAALEKWYARDAHPTYFRSFSEEERRSMLSDDLFAGRSVPLLLTTVIIIGVCLATLTVLLCW